MTEFGYPASWEADVVLRDGGAAHLRPIRPTDADAVQEFHEAQSEESVYLRFFAPLKRIPARELERFTNVDHHDRVAFVVTIGDRIIGIGRYDRTGEDTAEVAFNISDAHQGRGLGSVLLEHLAAAARERGMRKFTAEVLPQNSAMLGVFVQAGYEVARRFDDGVVDVRFDLDPTEKSRAVMAAREHRAESLSVRGLLHPRSVVVIGASRNPKSTGNLILRNLVDAGFAGDLWVVHPEADSVLGVPAYRTTAELPGPADIAVIAVPAESVIDVVRDCAAASVKGVVVVSSGFAETGDDGLRRQRELVRTARANGMRVVGPNSFGLLNADQDVRLNASLAPFLPPAGDFGLFSQSGALGIAVLASATRRGLGVSSFVSAGNRADLSGNDMMQYWEEDPGTRAVGLYLESIGNPRKFSRIARRLASTKPVVVVKSDITGSELPPGHSVRTSTSPREALDQMLHQAGVIRAGTIHRLFDVAGLLTAQPRPAGNRVGVVGNSAALATLVVQAGTARGLDMSADAVSLHPEASTDEFTRALANMYGRSDIDSVVVTFTPSTGASDTEVAGELAHVAATSGKTTVACFLGVHGVTDALSSTVGTGDERRTVAVPGYPSPEDAVWALAAVTNYSEWRRADHGSLVAPSDIDPRRAARLVSGWLGDGDGDVVLDSAQVAELLACYGIEILGSKIVSTVDDAVRAADDVGWPVALKAVEDRLRHRLDLGGVILNVDDATELSSDFAHLQRAITDLSGESGPAAVEVQAMAPTGVACVVRSGEDPLFGPLVSFGLAGDATELLGDVAYRVAPVTDVDVAELVRSVKASPRLFGRHGLPPTDVEALEALIARVSVLADDLPAVKSLELNPVVVSTSGVHLLGADVTLSPGADRNDAPRRRLA